MHCTSASWSKALGLSKSYSAQKSHISDLPAGNNMELGTHSQQASNSGALDECLT